MWRLKPLQFKRADLEREARALRTIADPFLDHQASWRFDEAIRQLESAPRRTDLDWQIPLDGPLVTNTSFGGYESGARHGPYEVVGSLCFVWQMKLAGDLVSLSGNASTRICMYDVRHDEGDRLHLLGTWHMDVGANDSPGPCFHVQVHGGDHPPFPRSLPVPRFPSFIPTPMAALEFLLGELFQDEWRSRVGSCQGASREWRSLQRERWKALLTWQLERVADGSPSPWMALKQFPATEASTFQAWKP